MNNILFEKPLVKEYFLSVDFILRKMKEQKRILQCILNYTFTISFVLQSIIEQHLFGLFVFHKICINESQYLFQYPTPNFIIKRKNCIIYKNEHIKSKLTRKNLSQES